MPFKVGACLPVFGNGLNIVATRLDPVAPCLQKLEHADLHGIEVPDHAVKYIGGNPKGYVAMEQRQFTGRFCSHGR